MLVPALLLALPWYAVCNAVVYGNLDILARGEHDAVVVGQLRTGRAGGSGRLGRGVATVCGVDLRQLLGCVRLDGRLDGCTRVHGVAGSDGGVNNRCSELPACTGCGQNGGAGGAMGKMALRKPF